MSDQQKDSGKKDHQNKEHHHKDHHKKDEDDNKCYPILRVGFGFINNTCDGSTHTLVESPLFPMENVTADMRNFGDCPVTYHFLTTRGNTISKTIQPEQSITIQVPGRIVLITGTCECSSSGCAPSSCEPRAGSTVLSRWGFTKSNANSSDASYYNDCKFGVLVRYTQCVCCPS